MFLGYYQAQNKKQNKLPNLFLGIYLIIIFLIQYFILGHLISYSKDFIISIQQSDESTKKFLYSFCEIFNKIAYFYSYSIIILIVFNWGNIYKSYTLFLSFFISCLFSGFFKILYKNPRPYLDIDSDLINPVEIDASWGNPSGNTITAVCFYLTLWEILFQNSKIKKKRILKFISFGLIFFAFIMIIISKLILAEHTLDQLLFGALLGFAIYFFLFYIIKIDTNEPGQLLSFIEIKNLIYGFVNFFIFLSGFILFLVYSDVETFNKHDAIISQKFPNENIPFSKKLNYDAFIVFSTFFAYFASFIGIKFEFYFIFYGNAHNWKAFNFNCRPNEDDTSSFMTSLSPIDQTTQWNHTNFLISIIRFIILISLVVFIVFPFTFIDWNSNFVIVLLFKVMLSLTCVCFSLFFLIKLLFKKMKLTNNTLYSRLIDDLDDPFN